MTKATDQITLQTLDTTKTMSFDEANGLVIASDDGNTKIVISDSSVSFFQNNTKVAEFNKDYLKLGMNANASNGAFIDLLNGVGKIASSPFGDSAKLDILSQYINTEARKHNADGTSGSKAFFDGTADYTNESTFSAVAEMVAEKHVPDFVDMKSASVQVMRTPTNSEVTLKGDSVVATNNDGRRFQLLEDHMTPFDANFNGIGLMPSSVKPTSSRIYTYTTPAYVRKGYIHFLADRGATGGNTIFLEMIDGTKTFRFGFPAYNAYATVSHFFPIKGGVTIRVYTDSANETWTARALRFLWRTEDEI